MPAVQILAAVRREQAGRYYKNLTSQPDFGVELVSDIQDALDILNQRGRATDLLVLDHGVPFLYELVDEVRHRYPRILIVLVDEGADLSMPNFADAVSTDPFTDADLVRRITKLMSDRALETLRADSLPVVRQFAKELRNAPGEMGKQQVTVKTCKALNYDYVAFYRLENAGERLTLKAHDGPAPIMAVAPAASMPNDLMQTVALNNESRIAQPQDTPNHPLVAKGRLGTVAAVPVMFSGNRYGVLLAFRDQPGTILQEHVLLLELMAAQLAAAISKELIR
jgi:DNA-binding response OmpR family regulator